MSTATLPVPLFASSIQTTDPYGKPFETSNLTDSRSIVFVDLDNVVYSKTTRIAEKMGVLIKSYFLQIGLEEVEANALHMKYYSEYGLAIRGLVKHHKVDPLHYDLNCDSALPLEEVLSPNVELIQLLSDIDRSKYRVWALTNAYVTHAIRVLNLTHLQSQFEAVVSCDYRVPNFYCKPELEFYAQAIKATGQLDPSKNYFVDDSFHNIFGSWKFGFGHSVLFDEFGDLAVKLNQLLEAEKENQVIAINGNGSANGKSIAGAGKVSIIRDVLDLRVVWPEIFVEKSV